LRRYQTKKLLAIKQIQFNAKDNVVGGGS